MGRTANVKKVKRAVQAIVDQVLNNEASLIGLTTLRDYDEYTFTHSVNVCIFSVALGRKLGLTKLQLYDLGMAALFSTSSGTRDLPTSWNRAAMPRSYSWSLVRPSLRPKATEKMQTLTECVNVYSS